MKIRTWKITCARPECGAVFEAKARLTFQFQSLYMKHGWVRRGSVTGPQYFCGKHKE